MGDVWQLENNQQIAGAEYINELYRCAVEYHSAQARNLLKRIYTGDGWDTIKKKMETEGSVWYVWYMDGVNTLLAMQNQAQGVTVSGTK
jgi:hypothetical protein